MQLETQTVYTILPPDEIGSNPLKWVVITSDNKTVILEKREGVILLTEAELSELKEQVRKEAFKLGYDTAMSMPD